MHGMVPDVQKERPRGVTLPDKLDRFVGNSVREVLPGASALKKSGYRIPRILRDPVLIAAIGPEIGAWAP